MQCFLTLALAAQSNLTALLGKASNLVINNEGVVLIQEPGSKDMPVNFGDIDLAAVIIDDKGNLTTIATAELSAEQFATFKASVALPEGTSWKAWRMGFATGGQLVVQSTISTMNGVINTANMVSGQLAFDDDDKPYVAGRTLAGSRTTRTFVETATNAGVDDNCDGPSA